MEVEGKEEGVCFLCARQNCGQLSGSRVPWNQSVGGWDAGPGLPRKENSQKPGRDGRDMMRDKADPVRDVMQEDQRPTE
jgi:hypothetical protein